jgi:hypothetical protein
LQTETSGPALSNPWIDIVTMVSRFYFHIFREGQRIIDRTGIELPEGTVMSRAVLKAIKERWPDTSDVDAWRGWSIEIVDAGGRTVRTIALDECCPR